MMAGQQSLSNFYESVKFQNPALAEEIRADVVLVSLGGLSAEPDKKAMQDAVDRLRRKAFDLPVIQARVLDSALSELGYGVQ